MAVNYGNKIFAPFLCLLLFTRIEKVVKNIKHKSKNNNTDFLLKNMRMSICELG